MENKKYRPSNGTEYEEFEVMKLKQLIHFMDKDGFKSLYKITDLDAIERRIQYIEMAIDDSICMTDFVNNIEEYSPKKISKAEKQKALKSIEYEKLYINKLREWLAEFINQKNNLIIQKHQYQTTRTNW